MGSLSSIVVVHDEAAPEARQLMALCQDHLALLHVVRWAGVDEVVGTSRMLSCEACALVGLALTRMPHPLAAARSDRRGDMAQ